MSRYRRSRRGYYPQQRQSSYKRNYGAEAAQRHIEEAQALSIRLGGMDKEVKAFFLGLNHAQFSEVLERYGDKFGQKPKDYARKAYPDWKSGKTKMSGLVAGRLFDLLPPIMPIDLKLKIVEGLFEKSGRNINEFVLVPESATPEEVIQFIDDASFSYLEKVEIDQGIKRQFEWLSGDDASVAEELFKHAVKATYNQKKHSAAMFVEQLDRERINHGDTIKDVSHTFRVRNHEVSVARSSAVEEMRMVDRMTFERRGRKPELRKPEADYSWLWWIGGLGLLWLFLSE